MMAGHGAAFPQHAVLTLGKDEQGADLLPLVVRTPVAFPAA